MKTYKSIQTARDAAAAITQTDPATVSQYNAQIENAKTAMTAATAAKNAASTEAEFNKACDDERHAVERKYFYEMQLEKLKYTTRMGEDDYYRIVSDVEKTMRDAAEDFRNAAIVAVNEIISAKRKYMDLAKEADQALTELDAASNVLQSKYRYKVYDDIDGQPVYREFPAEWRNHAVRYIDNAGAYNLAVKETIEGGQCINHRYLAAWKVPDIASIPDELTAM